MNKYKFLKYNLKDKKNSPYTVTKIIPKNKKKINYLKSVNEILDNLDIPEGKEIRLCILANRGWRGTSANYFTDIDKLKRHLYDPRTYVIEEKSDDYIKKFKISRIKILSRDKKMTF